MRKYFEVYFLYFLKPVLLTVCFISNLLYLKNSHFVNDFFYFIYLFAFLLKPIIYLIFFFGLIMNYPIRSTWDPLIYFFIVIGIFTGFPVKEISDFYKLNSYNYFFELLSEGYLYDDYMRTHYIFNLLIENVPITAFVLINNLILQNKFDYFEQYDPLIVNFSFVVINGMLVCAFTH